MTSSSGSRFLLLAAVILGACACAAAKAPAGGTVGHPPGAAANGGGLRIAVFPVQNLSGGPAPIREMPEEIKRGLAARKWSLLEDLVLERFMERHRVRYTGGLTMELGRAFRSELEVGAVLVATVDHYTPSNPPKIGITARLVSTGEKTTVLWAGGVSLAGDERPGLLGLGQVTDPDILRKKAIERIVGSLDGYLSRSRTVPDDGGSKAVENVPGYRAKHLPRGSFRRPDLRIPSAGIPARVAVLPFLDRSGRPYAGELMANHFLVEFARRSGIDVVEPGVVRQALLQSRLIMEGGLSFPQADLLREILGVDYVVTGEVMDYMDSQGYGGTPYAEFSTYVIDAARRQAVWMSSSQNRGDDRVVLFDWGKTYTAEAMVAEMVRAVTDRFLRSDPAAADVGHEKGVRPPNTRTESRG